MASQKAIAAADAVVALGAEGNNPALPPPWVMLTLVVEEALALQ